jgi:hypothetical protein
MHKNVLGCHIGGGAMRRILLGYGLRPNPTYGLLRIAYATLREGGAFGFTTATDNIYVFSCE